LFLNLTFGQVGEKIKTKTEGYMYQYKHMYNSPDTHVELCIYCIKF